MPAMATRVDGLRALAFGLLALAASASGFAQSRVPATEVRDAPSAKLATAASDSVGPAPASPVDRQRAELEAQRLLEAVRTAQKALTAAQEAGLGAQAVAQRAVHAADTELASASRRAHELALRSVALDRELASLEGRRAELDARLARQRAALGALLRSAHALGRHQQLKLVLGFEQGDALARLLAYHRAIERDRSQRLRAIARDLRDLASVRRGVAANRARWTEASRLQLVAVGTRTAARLQRKRGLVAIETAMGARSARIVALRRDEQGLVALLARLTDAIADVPKVLDDALPLSTLKGKLPWPARGKLLNVFGAANASGETSDGILIAASAGTEISAVAYGRVAYADWLKGYGLVVILDHGAGFMTLYAHNEALLKDVGDWVVRGEALATAGASGGRSESGVWFELRREGRPQNPAQWLTRR